MLSSVTEIFLWGFVNGICTLILKIQHDATIDVMSAYVIANTFSFILVRVLHNLVLCRHTVQLTLDDWMEKQHEIQDDVIMGKMTEEEANEKIELYKFMYEREMEKPIVTFAGTPAHLFDVYRKMNHLLGICPANNFKKLLWWHNKGTQTIIEVVNFLNIACGVFLIALDLIDRIDCFYHLKVFWAEENPHARLDFVFGTLNVFFAFISVFRSLVLFYLFVTWKCKCRSHKKSL